MLLALFAATGFLGLQYLQQRQAANHLLAQSREVLDTLDRLRTIIADLDAERRGYLITLDPAYLKAYGVSDESVRREAQALQALVANDPMQGLRATHLALTVSAKLREIDDIVKTARTSGLAALAMTRSIEEIRSQIDQMVDHERFLLADRETRADALEQRKTRLIAVAVVIVTVLAGATLALARFEARRRRKATEENVQLQSDVEERENKIRRLVDANIIGIIIWELEGRILEANDAFLRMVGYDREDLTSGRLHRTTLTPPEWRDRDARTVAELKRIGTAQSFEKAYLRKDGSRVPVLIGGAMFEEGTNQGVGFVLDLTERKRAEEALRASEERFRTFVDHATDAFFLLDEDWTVLDVNRQACDGLGYSSEELIGKHKSDFDVGLDDMSIQRLKQRMVAGEAITFETHHRRKDGTSFPVEVRVGRFEQGGQRYLCLVRDISERKRADDELRASEERFRTLVQFSFDVYWESGSRK